MDKMIVRIGFGIGFVVLLGGGGCSSTSGGGGGGGTTFTPSVNGSKPLSTLTASEKQQLCADASAYFQSADVRRAECKFSGFVTAALAAALDGTITDAQLQTACTQAINQCVSSSADAGAGTTTEMCNSNQAVPASCTATVAEYSACLSTFPQALGGSVPECNTLTRASLNSDAGSGDPGATPSTPACTTFQTKCPGVLGSTDNPDGGP